jgi:hypothetical protein
VVAKVREILAVSKQGALKFDIFFFFQSAKTYIRFLVRSNTFFQLSPLYGKIAFREAK